MLNTYIYIHVNKYIYIYIYVYVYIRNIYSVYIHIYIYTSPHSAMVILPGNSRAMLHALITVFTFITDTLDGHVPSAQPSQLVIQWLSQGSDVRLSQSI